MTSPPFANNNPHLDSAIMLERLRAELGRPLSKPATAPTPRAAELAPVARVPLHKGLRGQLARMPVIGSLALWVLSVLRLQRTRADLRLAQEAVTEALAIARTARDASGEQAEKLKRSLATLGGRVEEIEGRIEATEGRLEGRIEATEGRLEGRIEATEGRLEGHIEATEGRAADLSRRLDLLAAEIAFQQSRLARTLERKAAPERVLPARAPLPGALDSLFLQFEDAFRGSREEIKRRVRVHLERVALTGAGTADRVILDLGCGRGEWLEVLREKGLSGRGIDLNACNVELCQRLGLDVEQAEAIATLRSCPDSSLGGVTAFHLIEHLPFEDLVVLLDEALRTLVSGGSLLLETPNPENMMVSAKTFFFDPTHRHPIPPQVMSFVLRQRGFTEVEIVRLHPYPPDFNLDANQGQAENLLNELMFGPQDYAVIARRP